MKETLDLSKVIELIDRQIGYSEEDKVYFISYGADEPPLRFLYKNKSTSREELLTVASLAICEMYEKHYKSAEILWSIMNG